MFISLVYFKVLIYDEVKSTAVMAS